MAPHHEDQSCRSGFAHRAGAIVALLVGVFFLVGSYQLSLGKFSQPGPGLWPFLVGVVMVGASVLVLLTDTGGDHEPFTGQVHNVLLGAGALAVFITAFTYLGFILPGVLTFLFWLRFLARESWRKTALLATALTTLFYVLFVPVLGVPFPQDAVAGLWGGD